MAEPSQVAHPGDLLPMSVEKMGFLIDKLFDDCAPLQFLRELTKNSIESIQRLPTPTGEIRWDVDWTRFDLTDEQQIKLCLIDTGDGMSGPEMVRYINKLSASIGTQSRGGNFGVGAKISAAPLNHEGLVYLSWKNGVGSMIHLYFDKVRGLYGLSRYPNGEFWTNVSDDVKPAPIGEHGTMVVLLGSNEEENTAEPPPKAIMPRKWILRYLNTKFFQFPNGVSVKAREGWNLPRGDKHNFLRTVTGQGPWLNENCQAKGMVRLPQSKAIAHWWIIEEGVDLNSGHYSPGGHVAALYQNELYEMVHGNAGYARLQAFGIVFGCERVVLYIEPEDSLAQQVTSNTARSHLLIDNEPLEWSCYAAEFRESIPDDLAAYMDTIGMSAKHSDHRKAIRERLNSIRDLFRFSRYRPRKRGSFRVTDEQDNAGGGSARADGAREREEQGREGGSRGGRRGDIYSLFAEEKGVPAEQVNSPVEPEVRWVTIENGGRSSGDLEDRAARYLPGQNLLLINGDFRAFTDLAVRWEQLYERVPGAKSTIEDVAREWFEQQLIETVMAAHGLREKGLWSEQETEELWSEAALTAAVLPRYHININIKRTLGQRLGKLHQAA